MGRSFSRSITLDRSSDQNTKGRFDNDRSGYL
jgi:hypothetical protein